MKWLTVLVVLIATYFRFVDLGVRPLWVDEAFFYFLVQDIPRQEFVPWILAKLVSVFASLENELYLRLPFALAGIGLVLAIALHGHDRKAALIVALFIAVCPLFVFWSKMARPYMVGAFFITLGWRWPMFYVPALLTTPVALAGIDFVKVFKKYRKFFFTVLAIGIITFFIRPDAGKDWNLDFIYHAKRIWIIPITALCLYCLEYIFPGIKSKFHKHDLSI